MHRWVYASPLIGWLITTARGSGQAGRLSFHGKSLCDLFSCTLSSSAIVFAPPITFSILCWISLIYSGVSCLRAAIPRTLMLPSGCLAIIPFVGTKPVRERQKDDPVEVVDLKKQPSLIPTRSLSASTDDPCTQRQSTIPCSTENPLPPRYPLSAAVSPVTGP